MLMNTMLFIHYVYVYIHVCIYLFFFFDPAGLPYKYLVLCSGGGQVILQRL